MTHAAKHRYFGPDSPAWRVRVEFYSPPAWYTPPILDGVLAWVLNRIETEAEGRPGYTGPGWDRRGVFETLKRLLWYDGNVAVCTQFLPDPPADRVRESVKKHFHKRDQSLIDFGKARRRINTASAPYRNYDKPVPAVLTAGGEWHFVGDGEAVFRLAVDNLVGIGKEVNAGYGWVRSMHLEKSDWDRRKILAHRPVPAPIARQHGIDGRREFRTWRPPYWKVADAKECIVPA